MCICVFIRALLSLLRTCQVALGWLLPLGHSTPLGPNLQLFRVNLHTTSKLIRSFWNISFILHLAFCMLCVSAGQQQLLQPVAPSTMNAVIPGVVHRPQVQQITKNIVTLSNVQAPVVFSPHSNLTQPNSSNLQSFQSLSAPAVSNSKTKGKIFYSHFWLLSTCTDSCLFTQQIKSLLNEFCHHWNKITMQRKLCLI